MGLETEFGVVEVGRPQANPMLLSSLVVAAYASQSSGSGARWDYEDEDPLSDARGFRLERAAAHPSMLTDDPDAPAPPGPDHADQPGSSGVPVARARPAGDDPDEGATTTILSNGARLYV